MSQRISNKVWKKFQEHQARETIRKQKYGEVRPIIHLDADESKFVAVGNKLYVSKNWKTFPDFLLSYIAKAIGCSWGKAELAKPFEEQHIILKWYDGTSRFYSQQKADENGLFSAIPNGVTTAYLLLAYDLYILRHHSSLQNKIIKRLKHKDQFQGARYELFVAATCLRAGFDIEYEDDVDRKKKHPEFKATHKRTGQMILVEAKSRHRQGVLGFGVQKKSVPIMKARIGKLLNQALQKPTNYPYIIFIDLNLPPYPGQIFQKPWFKEIIKAASQIKGDLDPFNLIVFTNHPHHYVREDAPYPQNETASLFSQNPKVYVEHPKTILKIHEAALQFGNIPNDFPEKD